MVADAAVATRVLVSRASAMAPASATARIAAAVALAPKTAKH